MPSPQRPSWQVLLQPSAPSSLPSSQASWAGFTHCALRHCSPSAQSLASAQLANELGAPPVVRVMPSPQRASRQPLVQSSVSIAFWSSQDSKPGSPGATSSRTKPSPQRATTHPSRQPAVLAFASPSSQVEREWDDFEGMVQRRELGNLMIPSLLSAGGGVLVWGLLSP